MIAVTRLEDLKVRDTCWTQNQQIAYDYAANTVLPQLGERSVWIADAPRSPLSFEEAIEVLRALTELPIHKRYDNGMSINDREGGNISYIGNGFIQVAAVPRTKAEGWPGL